MGVREQMRGNARNTFQRVAHLLKSDSLQKPKWFEAARMVPPSRKSFRGAKPKLVEFEEDRFIRTFNQKHRHSKDLFLHLPKADQVGPAAAFVQRQLEIMRQGLKAREAFKAVEVEAQESLKQIHAEIELACTKETNETKTIADTSFEEKQQSLAYIDFEEETSLMNQRSTKIIAHSTEAFIIDAMRVDGLSRKEAEEEAVTVMNAHRKEIMDTFNEPVKSFPGSKFRTMKQQKRGRQTWNRVVGTDLPRHTFSPSPASSLPASSASEGGSQEKVNKES